MTAILKCDQAIFTSIRGPMGEGYRIVAASRGLRVEEKQVITRSSPSHDALCWSPEEEPHPGAFFGVGFFTLPTGRLCVAFSRYAGMEHTARGGQRVYTHNVVLDAQHFPHCGFNPFDVIRSLVAAGLDQPQLKPPPVLPALTLCVERGADGKRDGAAIASVDARIRRAALRLLFEDQVFVLPRHNEWNETVEALVLGLPGPLRAQASFSAGLKFAMSRNHKVQVFRDDDTLYRAKVEAQSGEYLGAGRTTDEDAKTAWTRLVDGHWAREAIDQLDFRTSRAFADFGPQARERVAVLYNQIDDMPSMRSKELLSLAMTQLGRSAKDIEEQVRAEWVAEGKKEITARAARVTVEEFDELWSGMVACLKMGGAHAMFIEPSLLGALRTVSRRDPLRAAETACEVLPFSAKVADALLEELLTSLCAKGPTLPTEHADRMIRLHDRLTSLRPDHAAVKRYGAMMDSLALPSASK